MHPFKSACAHTCTYTFPHSCSEIYHLHYKLKMLIWPLSDWGYYLLQASLKDITVPWRQEEQEGQHLYKLMQCPIQTMTHHARKATSLLFLRRKRTRRSFPVVCAARLWGNLFRLNVAIGFVRTARKLLKSMLMLSDQLSCYIWQYLYCRPICWNVISMKSWDSSTTSCKIKFKLFQCKFTLRLIVLV